MDALKLLALSGSLRRTSYNSAAIRALQLLAAPTVKVQIGAIDTLPLFNPDRENEAIPALVELKAQISDSHGLVIATPEYAHGISGPMKNALDWLVSGAEFPYKPIMLINTSPRAHHAQAALREVLTTMSGVIIEKASVSIPLLSSRLDAPGIVADTDMAGALAIGLAEFCREIRRLRCGQSEN